jgi:DNA replication protein DnaD
VLSVLQTWLEKCLDELAQFKARLQFRRAHQPDKQTFKQASPNEYDFNYTDSEVKRKFTNQVIVG